jgi:putative glutamine amidotransferase
LRAPKIAVTVPRQHSAAFREYRLRIEQSGGEPVEVTPDAEPESVIDSIQGLLLPGGGDVEPARYGAEQHPETDGIRPALDALEVELLRLARDRALPVLAICRGHQLVNVALGGALHQHIDGDGHRAIPCDAPSWEWESRWHTVRIEPDSRLAALVGGGELRVNSRHHQGVRPELLARGMRAVAFSPDGFIEASEARDGSWLLSVQWHPEREEVIGGCRALFEGFVRAASEQRTIETGDPVLR